MKKLLTPVRSLPTFCGVRAVTSNTEIPLNFERREGVGFLSFYESGLNQSFLDAHVAQLVEHILGKDEVSGSIPLMGSIIIFCCSGIIYFSEGSYG